MVRKYQRGFLIPYLREVKQLPDLHAVLGHKPFLPHSAKNIVTIYLSSVSTEESYFKVGMHDDVNVNKNRSF